MDDAEINDRVKKLVIEFDKHEWSSDLEITADADVWQNIASAVSDRSKLLRLLAISRDREEYWRDKGKKAVESVAPLTEENKKNTADLSRALERIKSLEMSILLLKKELNDIYEERNQCAVRCRDLEGTIRVLSSPLPSYRDPKGDG